MFDIQLRQWRDRIVDPILVRAVAAPITPLHLTAAAFAFGIQSCVFALNARITLSLLCWAANRLLDCLDGAVARARKQETDLGGFLDLLGDFIVYSSLPICCALSGAPQSEGPALLAVAMLEASFHVNNFVLFYIAALAEKRKSQGTSAAKELTSLTMRPALVEGAESGVFFTLMLMFPGHIRGLAYCMFGAVAFGTLQRVAWTWTVLKTS